MVIAVAAVGGKAAFLTFLNKKLNLFHKSLSRHCLSRPLHADWLKARQSQVQDSQL